jgi:hypothetical protein
MRAAHAKKFRPCSGTQRVHQTRGMDIAGGFTGRNQDLQGSILRNS